jgi:hypothetical protein
MSTQVQFRRGTTTQNNAFTGAVGELTVDTDLKTLRLHDGSTAGGGAIIVNTASAQQLLNKTMASGSVWNGTAVPLAYGGTGSSLTATAGALLYSTSSGAGLTLAGLTGQILVSGGTGAPTWVNGSTLTIGTAQTAVTAQNINGGSAGQLMIQSDVGVTSFITAGATGTFLQSAGAGYAPTWAAGQVTYGNSTVSLGGNLQMITGTMYVQTGNVYAANVIQDGGAIIANNANIAASTANALTTLDTFSTAQYRSARYTIQATAGSSYQTMEAIAIHNGTTPTVSTFGVTQTSGNLGTIAANISSGNMTISFIPSTSSTIVRIMKTYLPL